MATLSKNITEQQLAKAAIDNIANFAGTEPIPSGQCYYVRALGQDVPLLPILMCVIRTVSLESFAGLNFRGFRRFVPTHENFNPQNLHH